MRVLNKGGALWWSRHLARVWLINCLSPEPSAGANETYLEIGTVDEATFELIFRGNVCGTQTARYHYLQRCRDPRGGHRNSAHT